MRRRVAAGAIFLAGAVSACGGRGSAPPVATVSLTCTPSVAQGSVLDLTYRFQVAPDAHITGDYRVFVHLNRDDGTTIWFDDHDPPAGFRTSQWKPGQMIEYTRTRFIPTFSYLGTATIEMGLYKDDERLPLTGPEGPDQPRPDRSYKVATIELQPKSNRTRVFRLSGWHQVEYASDDPTVDWQWTQKAAILSVPNLKKDVMLYLEFDTRPEIFGGQPQVVTVYAGETKLASFPADSGSPSLQRIPVTAAQFGAGEMAQFRIEVDRTFVPARFPNMGTDQRELGIRVFHAHIEAR